MRDLGWTDDQEREFEPLRADGLFPARVASQHYGGLDLLLADGELPAIAARSLDEPPAVGDWAAVRRLPDEDKAVVEALLPRRTAFTRANPMTGETEVLAANVDTVFVVTALGRDLNPRRLERYLAAAHESGAQPVVLVNKADAGPDAVDEAIATAATAAAGAPVHAVSARSGRGVEALLPYLGTGRTVALLGSSGVGKSTLANRLLGEDVLATAEVRSGDQRGRHTTTRRQLVRLPVGGLLLDTPGLRELQLAEADLDEAFPEIAERADQCRFRDCTHVHEPGCAVLEAVEDGEIPRARYESFLKLRGELEELDALRERQRRQARGGGRRRA